MSREGIHFYWKINIIKLLKSEYLYEAIVPLSDVKKIILLHSNIDIYNLYTNIIL